MLLPLNCIISSKLPDKDTLIRRIIRKREGEFSCTRRRKKQKLHYINASDHVIVNGNKRLLVICEEKSVTVTGVMGLHPILSANHCHSISVAQIKFKHHMKYQNIIGFLICTSFNSKFEKLKTGSYLFTIKLHIMKKQNHDDVDCLFIYKNCKQCCKVQKQGSVRRVWSRTGLAANIIFMLGNNNVCVAHVFEPQHNEGNCICGLGYHEEFIKYCEKIRVLAKNMSRRKERLKTTWNCRTFLILSLSSRILPAKLQISLPFSISIFHHYSTEYEIGLKAYLQVYENQSIVVTTKSLTENCISNPYRILLDQLLGSTSLQEAIFIFKIALNTQIKRGCITFSRLWKSLNDLGDVLYNANDTEGALRCYGGAFLVAKTAEKSSQNHMITALLNIGKAYEIRREYIQAFYVYNEAHILKHEMIGNSNCLHLAWILCRMGLMQYFAQNFSESLDYYKESLEELLGVYKNEFNIDIALVLQYIGIVLHRLQRYKMAKAKFTKSIVIRRFLCGGAQNGDPVIPVLWFNIGAICFLMGDEEQAIKSLKQSLQLGEQQNIRRRQEKATTLQHLGQIYQQRGEYEEATLYYQEALGIENRPEIICNLFTLLGNINLMCANVDEMMKCYLCASRVVFPTTRRQGWHPLFINGHEMYGISRLHPICSASA